MQPKTRPGKPGERLLAQLREQPPTGRAAEGAQAHRAEVAREIAQQSGLRVGAVKRQVRDLLRLERAAGGGRPPRGRRLRVILRQTRELGGAEAARERWALLRRTGSTEGSAGGSEGLVVSVEKRVVTEVAGSLGTPGGVGAQGGGAGAGMADAMMPGAGGLAGESGTNEDRGGRPGRQGGGAGA